MKELSCDVAIMGAGIGGLCTGALLSNKGYRVVVVEKLSYLGGRCSTKQIKGYRIDLGVQMLLRNPLEDICHQVGVKLDLRFPKTLFSGIRARGQDYIVSGENPDELMDLILAPEENPEKLKRAIEQAVAWQTPEDNISVEDWFRQHTHNVETLARLQPFVAGTVGTNINEVSAAELFRFFRTSNRGVESSEPFAGLPMGGAIKPMQDLAGAIAARDGKVLSKTSAKRIIVSDGEAKGIIVEGDEGKTLINAQAVVSSIPPREMVAMAGKGNFDRGYLRRVAEETVDRSTPITHIHIGCNRLLMEPDGLLLTAHTRRLFQLYCPTHVMPEMAPPGKHVIIAAGMPRPCIEPISPRREFELNMLDIRENLPGFDEHGDVLMAMTFHKDWPMFGTWPGRGLPQKTPVVNLYLVGDRALPPGWVASSGVARTAQIVSEDIMFRFKPGKADTGR
jgi:phytoene dehydrogenase-like protein